MPRVSRSAKARALREARQLRHTAHQPLGCARCGEETLSLRFEDGELVCGDCADAGEVW